MVLRKCLLGGMGMLVMGTALYGIIPAASADELTTADEREGAVRLSDQPRRGGARLISQEEAASWGQVVAPGGAACAANPGAGTCGAEGCFVRPGMNGASADFCDPYNGGCPSCQPSHGGVHACRDHYSLRGRQCGSWCHQQCDMFAARNRQRSARLCAHFHGKLAYFTPMGNGGDGAPPFGCYHLVYAASPDYFDPRDGQVYAAQGYGVPMSVPLAPTVRHTMNYSSGIPASRLTPISTVVPPRRVW